MHLFPFRKKPVRPHSYRPQCEALEDRLVMTSLAGISGTLTPIKPPMPVPPPAQVVDLATQPHDQVAGSLGAKTTALYAFQLQQGDYLEADLSVGSLLRGAQVSGQLSILSASRATVGTSAANVPYGFYAPASGTYYAEVDGSASGLGAGYRLDLHRLVLAEEPQSVATLAQTGAMYAWLKGDTLNITGPTGYGFSISGNWKETTTTSNGQVTATYTATGTLTLQTAAGAVTLNLGASKATATTARQVHGDIFGVLSSLNLPVTLNTGSLVASFADAFGFNLNPLAENVTLNLKLGGAAGVGLGNSARLQATGAPLNSAVPYLYFTINPLGASATNVISVVFDPADPALFLGGKALGAIPMGPVSVSGIGFSREGLIPYTPVNAPSQYTGQMTSGDLLLQGSVNTTSLTVIPSSVDGSITLNLDPHHTGKLLGGTGVSAAALTGIFSSSFADVLGGSDSPVAQNLGAIFRNLSVGIDGTLSINPLASFQQDMSWQIGNAILGLPTGPSSFLDQVLNWANGQLGDPQNLALLSVGHGSLIYDGPTESLFFRGSTTNPFAGTPLASVYTAAVHLGAVPTFDLDAAVRSGGAFFLQVAGTSNIAGLPESGEILLARNYPVIGPATHYLSASTTTLPIGRFVAPARYTGIYLDAKVSVLGSYVELQGTMAGNGDFTLQAVAQMNLGGLSGSASFTLTDTHAQGFHFTAHLHAGFSSHYLRGSVDADFTFGVSHGHVTYAGSVSASGEVYVGVGWVGASLSGGIANGKLWISADGYKIVFNLQ